MICGMCVQNRAVKKIQSVKLIAANNQLVNVTGVQVKLMRMNIVRMSVPPYIHTYYSTI